MKTETRGRPKKPACEKLVQFSTKLHPIVEQYIRTMGYGKPGGQGGFLNRHFLPIIRRKKTLAANGETK